MRKKELIRGANGCERSSPLNEFLTILVLGSIGGGLLFALLQGQHNRIHLASCQSLNEKALPMPKSCDKFEIVPKMVTPAAEYDEEFN